MTVFFVYKIICGVYQVAVKENMIRLNHGLVFHDVCFTSVFVWVQDSR